MRPGEVPRDLQVRALIDVAAIDLTDAPGSAFTREQLLEKARFYAGPAFQLEEAEFDAELRRPAFVRPVRGTDLYEMK